MINKKVITNSMCFASLTPVKTFANYIIIEESKFLFKMSIIRRYLDDLKGMGFNFKYRYQIKQKRILVNVSQVKDRKLRISLFMMIRFLWEGLYKDNYDGQYDDFTQTIHHYFTIKKLLPKEVNNLVILCLAANCFVKGNSGKYNSNHYLCYSKSCNIIKSLDVILNKRLTSVNAVFTSDFNIIKDNKLKKAENWKKKDYINLFKEVNYDKT